MKLICDMENEKVAEPDDRYARRMSCRNLGMNGMCYKRSGSRICGNTIVHISLGCDGKCRRMKVWDNQNGYNGIEFDLMEML